MDEDEQLRLALAASLADQQQQPQHRPPTSTSQHAAATTDQEEEMALQLAMAVSLADAQQDANEQPQQQPMRQQEQQQRPSGASSSRPPAPPPQPQRPQQGAGGGSAGSGGGGKDWWPSPLRMLEDAAHKVAGELSRVAGELGSSGSCCAGCRQPLGYGNMLTALGGNWHPHCFKCAACGQSLGLEGAGVTFSVGDDGKPYHKACHKQLHHPHCCVCGDFIPERADGKIEWRESPFWRFRFCPAHSVDGTPQCCACNRLKPVPEEWVGLQDGRQLCLDCLDTLVVDTTNAQPLYDEVLAFFAGMGMPHLYKAPLLLVEGPVLEEYGDREGRPRASGAGGPVFHVRGLCVAHVYTTIPSVVRALGGSAAAVSSINTLLQRPQQQHCTVTSLLVMYGLPRLLCGSILAHELMHAYLRMRNVTGLPLQVEEGLCQLMAALWLDSQDHWAKTRPGGSAAYQERLLSYLSWSIRTDTSEVYGDGFRLALERFQQRGLRALVEHVIANGAWPEWAA